MLMRPHDGAVDEDVLEVGIIAQRRKKPFPDPIAAPAVEPLIHRVPAPELLRQNAPMRSRPRQPQDRLDKQPIVSARPARIACLARQMRFNPLPKRVAYFLSLHPCRPPNSQRSEEHTSELQSLMRTSSAVFCLKNK